MKNFFLIFILLLLGFSLSAEKYKPKLAIMEFEDSSQTLDKKMLVNAAEYLRGEFVSANTFIVIAKERQEKMLIQEMKKESHKQCYDETCQIPLGQALSADHILRTTINYFGGIYTITTEMIDLAKEATIKGAKFKFDGSEQGMMKAMDKIVAQLAGKTVQLKKVIPVKKRSVAKQAHVEQTPVEQTPVEQIHTAQNLSSSSSNKKHIGLPAKKREKYHPYWKSGLSLTIIGVALAVGGSLGFNAAASHQYDLYATNTTDAAISIAILQGKNRDDYLKDMNKYTDKGDTYRTLSIISGVTGGALAVTGVILMLIPKEKKAMQKVTVFADRHSFYAQLGFEF